MVGTHTGASGLPVLGHALEEISDAHVIVLIRRRQTEGETVEDQLNKREHATDKIALVNIICCIVTGDKYIPRMFQTMVNRMSLYLQAA